MTANSIPLLSEGEPASTGTAEPVGATGNRGAGASPGDASEAGAWIPSLSIATIAGREIGGKVYVGTPQILHEFGRESLAYIDPSLLIDDERVEKYGSSAFRVGPAWTAPTRNSIEPTYMGSVSLDSVLPQVGREVFEPRVADYHAYGSAYVFSAQQT